MKLYRAWKYYDMIRAFSMQVWKKKKIKRLDERILTLLVHRWTFSDGLRNQRPIFLPFLFTFSSVFVRFFAVAYGDEELFYGQATWAKLSWSWQRLKSPWRLFWALDMRQPAHVFSDKNHTTYSTQTLVLLGFWVVSHIKVLDTHLFFLPSHYKESSLL